MCFGWRFRKFCHCSSFTVTFLGTTRCHTEFIQNSTFNKCIESVDIYNKSLIARMTFFFCKTTLIRTQTVWQTPQPKLSIGLCSFLLQFPWSWFHQISIFSIQTIAMWSVSFSAKVEMISKLGDCFASTPATDKSAGRVLVSRY